MNCHLCGTVFTPSDTVFQREVYAGRSQRVHYGRRRVSVSNNTRYSIRPVCHACARQLDQQKTRATIIKMAAVIVGALLLFIFLRAT